ncbi:hypothetical protein GCM10028813_03770 [Ramlibacter alkalitolerans]
MFQASSAMRTFCVALSGVKGGTGGRIASGTDCGGDMLASGGRRIMRIPTAPCKDAAIAEEYFDPQQRAPRTVVGVRTCPARGSSYGAFRRRTDAHIPPRLVTWRHCHRSAP